MAMMAQQQGQGVVPAEMMPPQGGGMPDLSQLPPEIIQALLAQLQGGQPPMGGMPPI
jgi:hypothetical protein